ncbi:MAG: nucleoside triphosphate pyrophosphohydrolase [Oscillatoriales cyanobacterium SM2_2_1]|nr:nucleoside triphosphate pyrophosphohydrolase [Oscillatoriales cyanobacterium SM2_2_1]
MNPTLAAFERLIAVVSQLRSPEGGCPWDLAQTPQTLIPFAIEEAYELVDALNRNVPEDIAEELGDVLLQVVLHAQIGGEQGQFSLQTVIEGLTEKLIRRHPHVFGTVTVQDAAEVNRNWHRIKAQEKGEVAEEAGQLSAKLQRYARTLPPLTAALKISQKVAQHGFDWDNPEQIWQKLAEEVQEFRTAATPEHRTEELGDLLFSVVQVARWHGIDPAIALQQTNHKFASRFRVMEQLSAKPITECTTAELESLWQQAKQVLSS